MNSKSHVVIIEAPADEAHRFLASIDNLPRWATTFCKKLEKSPDGLHRLDTPQGPMLFRIAAEAGSGVVDMHGGPTAEQMVYWPARVVALGPSRSAFVFTMFQWPGMPDESFEGQSRALASELQNVKSLVERKAA
jgi:hypothetical protein